jgi:hypothetical protein
MTQKEKTEKYNECCVMAGDHFTKMEYHRMMFEKFSKEALQVLTTKTEGTDGKDSKNTAS